MKVNIKRDNDTCKSKQICITFGCYAQTTSHILAESECFCVCSFHAEAKPLIIGFLHPWFSLLLLQGWTWANGPFQCLRGNFLESDRCDTSKQKKNRQICVRREDATLTSYMQRKNCSTYYVLISKNVFHIKMGIFINYWRTFL